MLNAEQDPWDANMTATAQQREQRQRSLRFLMMFLLMLTLMDGEEVQRQQNREQRLRQRKQAKEVVMDEHVHKSRRNQDSKLQSILDDHPRYQRLVKRNDGMDYDKEVREWAEQQTELQKDEFDLQEMNEQWDPLEDKRVFHYPWNASGFYRGEWSRNFTLSIKNETASSEKARKLVSAREVESQLLERLQDNVGVVLLPDELQFNISNSTASDNRKTHVQPTFLRGAAEEPRDPLQITLTKSSGRAAFQFYSRQVPGIREFSIIDGFLKLYDSNSLGSSTRRDILLRVNGVVVHSLGLVSLTSSPSKGRSALVMKTSRRRLQESIAMGSDIEKIRDHALALYPPEQDADPSQDPRYESSILSMDVDSGNRDLLERYSNATNITDNESEVVFPYPFVVDDSLRTIGQARTPTARSMPPSEQLLEVNAGDCEFEINLRVQEEEWTVGAWRKLQSRFVKDLAKLDPSYHDETTAEEGRTKKRKIKKKVIQDQALIMTLNGTITSGNCNFSANLNATALRTDWENTTGKAINYSFYMMLTCLAQIVLLLRQLLHSQGQSAAARVSLLCVGWQTVLDALICLMHTYLSLAIQPLFTAFASVAFFKLLIFCVIEMKYMAIIVQSRNASNGGNTVEQLRRQIAMLHLRFYVAFLGSFISFFYAWENYKIVYMLAQYSFWVPQIVLNINTEAKRPLHQYYVCGMSISRLVVPLYMFGMKNNFLKEMYPESPTDIYMCELLVLWVAIQAAILEAQGRYGARFMIPARFLPPKFDYNRPIPPSLLPEEAEEDSNPSVSLQKERGGSEVRTPLVPLESPGSRRGARNRMKGNRTTGPSSMTTETINETHSRVTPCFDCVICYNEIDIRNRSGYMLAPCDHLFHKDCLVQWMEVKMECPICRTALPSL